MTEPYISNNQSLLRQAWVEINQQALIDNFRLIRDRIGADVKAMAVVKADAYGHGAVQCAKLLATAGADQFAVATLAEAIELRQAGIIQPILIIGYVAENDAELAIRYQIALTAASYQMACAIAAVARKLAMPTHIQIKLNTGMNRLGFAPNTESLRQMEQIFAMPELKVDGIFSHFAEADSISDFTAQQFAVFTDFISQCAAVGLHFPLKHIANSAAIIDHPQTLLDMVRPGIILYGCQPSAVTTEIGLQPVLYLKARIVQIHHIPSGEGAGYGRIRRVDRPSLIADIPLGYADGVPRLISERGFVLINGQRAPLAGRVCMDQMLADITAIPNVQVGDEVVLIGKQGNEQITAAEFAGWANTINYEVLTHMPLRLPRIYG